jgi:hypothetical protein
MVLSDMVRGCVRGCVEECCGIFLFHVLAKPPPSQGKTATIDSYTRNPNKFTQKKIKLRSL